MPETADAGASGDPGVDLDRLADGYRHRRPSPAALQRAERSAGGIPPGAWAADVGGGHGHHAAVFDGVGLRAVVVDPGRGMRREAVARGLRVVGGMSQALPFRDGSISLVYFHLSIHYGSWEGAVDEAVRVLAPDGRCVVWTLGPAHHRSSMLARWFPSVGAIDAARFPEPGGVAARFAGLGMSVRRSQEREEVVRTAGDWARAVEAGFVSTLQLVPGEELRRGLDEFRTAHPDPAVEVAYHLLYDQIVATRGRLR